MLGETRTRPRTELSEVSPSAVPMDPAWGSRSGHRTAHASTAHASTAHASYHPTRWPLVNHLLDVADIVTRGHADWIQRLATYLVFGGTAALVNLGVFVLVLRIRLPFSDVVHNLVAFVAAAEASTMVNFVLNDVVTFRHLPGHSRHWVARCARFHATCIVGTILAYLIQLGLHFALGMPAFLAEAVAIVLLTAFNFTSHHLFTYRRLKSSAAHAPR
jgi:putative flippase GtrA